MRQKYYRQQSENDCVPLAILNALKWQGRRFSIKSLNGIKHRCHNNKFDGTPNFYVYEAVTRYFGKVFTFFNPKLEEIEDIVSKGHVMILTYSGSPYAGDEKGHAFLCLGVSEDHQKFYCVNCFGEVESVPRRLLREHLRPRTIEAMGWMITRRDNQTRPTSLESRIIEAYEEYAYDDAEYDAEEYDYDAVLRYIIEKQQHDFRCEKTLRLPFLNLIHGCRHR